MRAGVFHGHEFIGLVEATAAAVAGVRAGDHAIKVLVEVAG